ncbi:MAG TPA: acyl-CoA thioesterase II [Gammaproteobacteria bacterium]|nr:acyl-CoA thioesterase II [Gammaproteobacteria bacterium]
MNKTYWPPALDLYASKNPLERLLCLLDLEPIEENLFRGYHPPDRKKRLFGGQVIAQALVAAMNTVPMDRSPHSLHAYFLRAGDPGLPALFEVERIRDGKSFTTRRVVVVQNGLAIFTMDASFHITEEGLSHQEPMPELSPPSENQLVDGLRQRPFLSYRENHKQLLEQVPQEPEQQIWIKANGLAPLEPRIHLALLAYESDEALLGTARMPHRGKFERSNMQVASLDHSIWFHEAVNVNDWLLYRLDSPAAAAARGYTRGSIFSAEGKLVASCMQEGLIRLRS